MEIAWRSHGDRVEIAWRLRGDRGVPALPPSAPPPSERRAGGDQAPCWRWLAWLVVTVRAPTWLELGLGVGVGVGGRACCRGAAELGARWREVRSRRRLRSRSRRRLIEATPYALTHTSKCTYACAYVHGECAFMHVHACVRTAALPSPAHHRRHRGEGQEGSAGRPGGRLAP